ncbi:MAG: CPBP family glutamic-type intramembrane protease [Bacteroidia bacterium]
MFWQELKKIFLASGAHGVYWRIHALGILLLYEILIHIYLGPQARANLREADSWFAFFIDIFGWFATLFLSIGIAIDVFIPLWQDLKGIKTPKEKGKDKKIAEAWEKANGGKDVMKVAGIDGYKASPKKPFKVNTWVLARVAFEGFTFGALAFVLLRYPTYYLTGYLTEWNFTMEGNDLLRHLNIGWWHYLGLALGVGLIKELLFRSFLFNFFIKFLDNFFKKKPSKGTGGLFTWAFSFIPSKTIKWGKDTVKLSRQILVAVIVSVIYALTHALILDSPSVYTIVGLFIFSMGLSFLYLWRGLAVAIWCHIWYLIFYFLIMTIA